MGRRYTKQAPSATRLDGRLLLLGLIFVAAIVTWMLVSPAGQDLLDSVQVKYLNG